MGFTMPAKKEVMKDEHTTEQWRRSLDESSDNKSNSDSFQTGTVDDDIQSIRDALTTKESLQVFRLRALVILILVLAAVSLSLVVFFLERNAHTAQFEASFYGIAGKIIDSLEEVTASISSLTSLSVIASVESEHQEHMNWTNKRNDSISDWPFISIDAFQQRASNVRSQSKSIFVSVNPIVAAKELTSWEKYVQSDANTWIAEGFRIQEERGLDRFTNTSRGDAAWLSNSTVPPLHTFDSAGNPRLSDGEGIMLPRWQSSPVLYTSMVNENLMENLAVAQLMKSCITTKSVVLGGFHSAPPGSISHPDATTSLFAMLLSIWDQEEVEYQGDPVSHIAIPIFDNPGEHHDVVGVVESLIYWRWFMREIVPKDIMGLTVVVKNNCTGSFTYHVNGPEVNAFGVGDRHDHNYNKYVVRGSILEDTIDDGTLLGIPFSDDSCPYSFYVYPAADAFDEYISNQPLIYCSSLAVVFAFTIAMFLIYDRLVERRQRILLAKATQSTAIVASLFPKQVRDRLLMVESQNAERGGSAPHANQLESFLTKKTRISQIQSQPIADFFPSCTVFFADIAGFTAWSSTREPSQVFVLLQTVYQNFDAIAKQRKVFKVETIGDSYVAVTGLPEPQPKHAVIMVKFAWDCLVRIGEITKELEVTLGPDTNDLSMRFGLHSGSVTAGVLKGDRARFQLFGDTVNTASRMESTGMKGRIQVSEETAELLRNEGKGSWLTQRVDPVHAKGKGTLTTYWVAVNTYCSSTSTDSSDEDQAIQNDPHVTMTPPSGRRHRVETHYQHSGSRLVNWMTKVLLQHVSTFAVIREQTSNTPDLVDADLNYQAPEGTICLDEVPDAIVMPEFNMSVHDAIQKSSLAEVPKEIADQLQAYVALIARSYRQNPFHNFEHACHVVMSVTKLLRRILVQDASPCINSSESEKARCGRALDSHKFTYGLTSDPMCSFATVFSALIHDVDHQGISNEQLIQEEPAIGVQYRNRCVAEQNSIDVAWDLLMSPQFVELRRYIFASHQELMRFRQWLVNNVIATDIFDKDNRDRRAARWNQVCSKQSTSEPDDKLNDLRATIIMEHVMQASDVSHTMQHWHVYIKWNRRLFAEMYKAWKEGRMAADPREFWYKGELGFFDNYVIPLAKKLKECAAFGVSSAEYLGYALQNRSEWEVRGEEIVRNMIAECDLSTVAATEGSFSDSFWQ